MNIKIFFFYQPQPKTVNEWATMLTLTLAPLIVHIAGGLPRLIVLSDSAQPT